ncbi:hypothetical protein G8764_06130 [Pseudomaricurvus alcaniphilus]|uniref:C-glycoside deglycosidase beta subunit domain-containing protein n=1 Tax=Pseudomaricurvus alcaniphilus TaxID=1166482 RepID=UPI00140775A2|nr:DUF6379 domain-containing protein [Pseudomaricurvus alcaniphilus]NHN36869.1 hypothetical protein [Pseudomaricurvus alcaniphilus]
MIDHRIIDSNSLTLSKQGVTVSIQLPWYRALPLSVISLDKIEVDGQSFDVPELTFELNGKKIKVKELQDHFDEFWFVLDSAVVHLDECVVKAGESHRVFVAFTVKPPYLSGFTLPVVCEKDIVAVEV